MADDSDADSPRKLPDLSIPQLEECLWIAAKDGSVTNLSKFIEERSSHPKFKQALDCENEEYEFEGGSLLQHCARRGCDKGKSSKADFPGCMTLLVNAGADIERQDRRQRTPLGFCVINKYTNYTKHLLNLGARPDIPDQDDRSPFHSAIELGYKDVINIFLAHKPELLHVRNNKGVPPLVIAAEHGQLETCRLLLERGADINAAEEKTRRTAIFQAVRGTKMAIFDMLLKHDPKLDIVDTDGQTLLYLCCALSDLKYFHKLVSHCPTFSRTIMEQQAEDNKTPVIVACQNGNSEQLKHLLEQGASVTSKDVNEKTALHYCADNLETQCAEMLLDKDLSILDIKDDQGFTALALAVHLGNTNLVKLLLDKGADIDTSDNGGHKLGHMASASGHLKVMDMLMQRKADFSSPDNNHACPIHYAAKGEGPEGNKADPKLMEKVLKKVIEYKVKMDVEDDTGRQPLHWAACTGNAGACKLLVMSGADTNSRDKLDLTALHCAASRGHQECIEMLLKKGADCNLMDKNKCTPLFYAITLGNKDCTKAIINAKADVNHVDDRGRNPAHCAAIKGCLDSLKLLEKEKADLWIQNNKGDYPIHEAAQKGHIDVVKYMIRLKNDGSAVNITNKVGKTLLHIAAATNNLPLCKMLINLSCDKNATMKQSDKELTAYDLAVIRNYKETADYLKSQGALSSADLKNTDKKEKDDGKKRKKGQKEVVLTPVEKENKDTKDKKTPVSPTKSGASGSPTKSGASSSPAKSGANGSPAKSGANGSPVKRPKSPEKKGTAVAVAAAAGVAGKGEKEARKEDKKEDKTGTKGKPETSKKDSTSEKEDKDTKEKTETAQKETSGKQPIKKDKQSGSVDSVNKESKEKAEQQTKSDPKSKVVGKSPVKINKEKEVEEKSKSDTKDGGVGVKDKGKTTPDDSKTKQEEKSKSTSVDSKTNQEEKGKSPTVAQPIAVEKVEKSATAAPKEKDTNSQKEKAIDKNKTILKKQPSADSVLDKEDGIGTSTASLRSNESPTSSSGTKDAKEVNQGTSPTGKMGNILGKKKESGKFVSLERTEIKDNKSEGPETSRSRKSHRVGFNKSDNDDSGNETDHSHSRRKPKKRQSNFDHIHKSVKSYENIRHNSRMLQQLKRAQIHTGPMHDIVMFSKMMDNYRRGMGEEAEETDMRAYANWDGYLNDQLRFVSHLYNEDNKSPREIQDTAKEHHAMLETEAKNRKKDTDMRCTLILENEEVQRRKNTDMDREIDHLASRTAEMFDSVRTGASSSVASAKTRNVQLREEMRRTREEKIQNTDNPHEREILRRQQMEDDLMDQDSELDTGRQEKFKKWHRRKDEEMRRRLLQAYRPYFPTDVFQPRQAKSLPPEPTRNHVCVSGGRVKSAGRLRIEPSPAPSRRSHPSPRPGSHKSATDSNYSVAQYKLKEDKTQVQMTPYGLRRVRNQERPTYEDVEDGLADAIFFSPGRCTKSADAAANWSRKYDGSIRPRTGLVFVEPRVYDDLMREEKTAKQRISSEVRASQTLVNGDVRHGAPRTERSDSLVS